MDDYNKANLVIWIFAVILVGFTFVQAFLFVRRALAFNKKHELFTTEELKEMAKTGASAALAPGINTIFLGISFMAIVGSGLMFMRLGVIGAPMYEMIMVQYASNFAGIDISAPKTASMLAFFAWAGAVGTLGFISCVFTLRPIEMAGRKKNSGKPNIVMKCLPKAGTAVMAVMGYNSIMTSKPAAVTYIAGVLAAVIVYIFVGKGNKKLASWAILICSIVGITCGQIVASMTAA